MHLAPDPLLIRPRQGSLRLRQLACSCHSLTQQDNDNIDSNKDGYGYSLLAKQQRAVEK